MMLNTVVKHKKTCFAPPPPSDLSRYIISFGSKNAPNKIEVFYGVECGFSQEFLQNDFKHLLESFVLTGKAFIRLYPAALDSYTLAFSEMIYSLPLVVKRQTFMQLCHSTDYRLLTSKLSATALEMVFFDIVKILEQNCEILETLIIRLNGKILDEIPSIYALQEKIN